MPGMINDGPIMVGGKGLNPMQSVGNGQASINGGMLPGSLSAARYLTDPNTVPGEINPATGQPYITNQ